MNNIATKQDIAEAISGLSSSIDGKFEDVVGAISEFSTRVDGRFNRVETDIATIKSTMVTKNYLDEKLGDLRGDLVALSRKTNRKLSSLVNEMVEQGSLTEEAAEKILAMEPFAQ